MAIDIDRVLTAPAHHVAGSWRRDEVILYHLGVGAGHDPVNPKELEYVLEDRLKVLPTFGVIHASAGAGGPLRAPGMDFDGALMLHGEQEIVVHRPVPPEASVESTARVAAVYDKGKAALAIIEVDTVDDAGEPLFTNRFSMFLRGAGGFGGDPGPKSESAAPRHDPDLEIEIPTLPQQALLYRLSGDRNPLHADPAIAERAGFDRPIAHGLCTWGISCKAIVDHVLDGEVGAVGGWTARFASPVYPGETLSMSIWIDTDRVHAEVSTKERQNVALANAVLTVRR